MNKIIVWFMGFELAIGFCVTIWFVVKKILLPVLYFIINYYTSYKDFKKWRKWHGKYYS